VKAFKESELDLPEGSIIYLGRQGLLTDYDHEDPLKEAGLHLLRAWSARRTPNGRFWRGRSFWASDFVDTSKRSLIEPSDKLLLGEDPYGHAEGLRTEGRLLPTLAFSIQCL
jgi:hypothetical protein